MKKSPKVKANQQARKARRGPTRHALTAPQIQRMLAEAGASQPAKERTAIGSQERPANPKARLVWVNNQHGVQTHEIIKEETHVVGKDREYKLLKLRPRFTIDGKLVVGRMVTMRPNDVHTTAAAAKREAIKQISEMISMYQKDLAEVRAFKPGKAA